MVVYGIFAYLFLYSGFNTNTKVRVNYEDKSDIYYKVNYKDDSYNSTYNDKYVSDMVKNIELEYTYDNLISEYVSGYYKYSVVGYLIAYEDDIANSLWERKYELVKENVKVIDEGDVNNIKIDDRVVIDYNKYKRELQKFIDDYGIDVDGYLHVRINVMQSLNFDSLDNEYSDEKVITLNIPLSEEVFKIKVNNINNRDSYYEFSKNRSMNIIFLVIGAFSLALSISSVLMVIKQFKYLKDRQSKYKKELKKILSKYEDCIVNVNKLYVNKKYNMIYVNSFLELMDVYNKKGKMISYKEVKRDSEAIFVIIDLDDAWIYRLDKDILE